MSLDPHRRAEMLMGQADALSVQDRRAEAQGLYREAAQLEAEAFQSVPIDRPRTRGVLAVSCVALFKKAQALEEALLHAHRYLSDLVNRRVRVSGYRRGRAFYVRDIVEEPGTTDEDQHATE